MIETNRIRLVCLTAAWLLTGSCGEGDVDGPAFNPVRRGKVLVLVSTIGEDIDADGYTLMVDGTQGQTIAVNESRLLSGVPVGQHTLELQDLAGNCFSSLRSQTTTVTENQTT